MEADQLFDHLVPRQEEGVDVQEVLQSVREAVLRRLPPVRDDDGDAVLGTRDAHGGVEHLRMTGHVTPTVAVQDHPPVWLTLLIVVVVAVVVETLLPQQLARCRRRQQDAATDRPGAPVAFPDDLRRFLILAAQQELAGTRQLNLLDANTRLHEGSVQQPQDRVDREARVDLLDLLCRQARRDACLHSRKRAA